MTSTSTVRRVATRVGALVASTALVLAAGVGVADAAAKKGATLHGPSTNGATLH